MPEDLPELTKILHSGALAYGDWGKKFEKKLAQYLNNSNVVIVNSFNSAMLVTLATLGVKPGDEIIASPMSCLASNQPFASIFAKVVWADIDPETGTLDPESVKEKLTSKTKAVFHNHHCGYPGYIDEINLIGKENGVFVVDDAIEAFGSEYKGKVIGNVGSDATVYSFQTVRLPNTIEGGAISFNSKELYEKAKIIRDLGVDRSKFRNQIGEISKDCDITERGYGATLSDLNSYIGCLQMSDFEALISKQRSNYKIWSEEINSMFDDINVLGKDFQRPNGWVFGLLSSKKPEYIKYFRERGLYSSGVHLPNSNYTIFGQADDLIGVNDFYNKFLTLPNGWWFDNKGLPNV